LKASRITYLFSPSIEGACRLLDKSNALLNDFFLVSEKGLEQTKLLKKSLGKINAL
jgi:hypothetical protein